MIKSDHKVNKRDFLNKKRSILKRKIIKTLKAYTLRDFSVNESINTVTCKMSMRRDDIVKELSTNFTIIYQVIPIANNEEDITLQLNISMS